MGWLSILFPVLLLAVIITVLRLLPRGRINSAPGKRRHRRAGNASADGGPTFDGLAGHSNHSGHSGHGGDSSGFDGGSSGGGDGGGGGGGD